MALNSSCCSALNIVTKWKLLKRLLQNNTVILFLFTDFHKNYFGHILVKNMNKIHVFFPRLGNTLSVLRADLGFHAFLNVTYFKICCHSAGLRL